jgi:hypothetical protein
MNLLLRRANVSRKESRRLLELLAASPEGCTEPLLAAHGFPKNLIVGVVRVGLATANADSIFAGGREVVVSRVRITDAGRQALAERQG